MLFTGAIAARATGHRSLRLPCSGRTERVR